jgi:hypothetical protein
MADLRLDVDILSEIIPSVRAIPQWLFPRCAGSGFDTLCDV